MANIEKNFTNLTVCSRYLTRDNREVRIVAEYYSGIGFEDEDGVFYDITGVCPTNNASDLVHLISEIPVFYTIVSSLTDQTLWENYTKVV